MSNEFEYLLHLLYCGAMNVTPSAPKKSIDWQALLLCAQEQSVLSLTQYAIKRANFIVLPYIKRSAVSGVRDAAVNVTVRKAASIRLLKQFQDAGICAKVIKGFAIAECYAVPECRVSYDIDVLVAPNDERRSFDVLRKNGFLIKKRLKHQHESACYHPQIGTIELHVKLFGDYIGESIFSGINLDEMIQEQPYVMQSIDGDYNTLGITDHLIILFVHMVKHFVSSGANLRMLLDIIMYCKKNDEMIDYSRLLYVSKRIHCDMFLATIFALGEIYLNIKISSVDVLWPTASSVQIDSLLTDLEQCGGMNFASPERVQSKEIVIRKRLLSKKSRLSYKLYMFNHFITSCATSLFPSTTHLAAQYPYIKKHPILTPYAGIYRFFTRGMKTLFGGGSSLRVSKKRDLSREVQARLEVFRTLEIL